MKNKFTWGDAVDIVTGAPEKYSKIGSEGDVVGFRTLNTTESSQQFQEPIGTIVYLVEGSNGYALEIPENYLILAKSGN